MKYLKKYENITKFFERNFNNGDHIICINDTSQWLLKNYQEYVVSDTNINGLGNIGVEDLDGNYKGSWGKFRFVHADDFEDWKLQNNMDKYNI